MREEERLVETLRKIEALFARPATEGERAAAGNALERIRQRLKQLESIEPPVEYRFTLSDAWSTSLFVALLRRYDLTPFRYRGQRRTTVMTRVTRSFVDETLWPEFEQLSTTLRRYLDDVTQRVIAEAIHGDVTDAEERSTGATTKQDTSAAIQASLGLE
jgi:hypothetical protein